MRIYRYSDGRSPQSLLAEKLQERNKADVDSQKDKLKIRKDTVEIKVDNYPSQYDIGYRKTLDFIKERAQKSLANGYKKIGEIAQSGDKLMDFKNYDIAQVVKEEDREEELDIGLTHRRMPEITVKSPQLEIDLELKA